jgi:small subunit ribosomal protein S16
MVKLRLKRFGKKREASYRIVAIDSRARRQGRPIQELGFYNPRTKETTLKAAEIVQWLRNGAQPTETLAALLKKARIYDLLQSGAEISSEPLVIAGQPKSSPTQTATAVAEAPAAVAVEAAPAVETAIAAEASEAESADDADSETESADAEASEDAAADSASA